MTTSAQDKYVKRMKDGGMRKCSVWIPEQKKETLSEYARKLRHEDIAKRAKNEG